MSDIFGNTGIRGCFSHVNINAGNSRGAQLIMPAGFELPTYSFADPLLCTGFQVSIKEVTLYNKCFGNRVYTYAFGHDPNRSVVVVSFVAFLVDKTQYSGVVDTMMDSYKQSRVSQSRKVAKLLLGNSKPLQGFVTGLESGTLDPKHSLQEFKVILDVPGLD